MKYTSISLIILVSLCWNACKNMDQSMVAGKPFSIKGTIHGQDTGNVYLLKYAAASYVKIDSTTLKEGKFTFKGNVEIPQRYYIQLANEKARAAFFMEGGDLQFSASADSLREFDLAGSSLQQLFEEYDARHKAHKQQLGILGKQIKEAKVAEDERQVKALEERGDSLYKAGIRQSRSYIGQHATSPVATYVLYRDLSQSSDYELLDSLYNELDSSVTTVPYAQMVADRIAILKSVAVGQKVKHFVLPDSSGVELSSESYAGKYLLIDFWASWCRPCRVENPNVVASYKDFRKKGFEILGVSLDTDRGKWLKAIDDDGLIWPNVSDLKGWSSKAGKLYGVKAIPHTILVDPEGTIIAWDLRGDKLRDKLEELLGE